MRLPASRSACFTQVEIDCRLELTRQLFGRASGSHQIDHLSPELRRISGSLTGHQTPQKSTSKVSTKPGQLQLHQSAAFFNAAPNFSARLSSRTDGASGYAILGAQSPRLPVVARDRSSAVRSSRASESHQEKLRRNLVTSSAAVRPSTIAATCAPQAASAARFSSAHVCF
jgi:hypothetical protein